MDGHLLWNIALIFSLIYHTEMFKIEYRKKRSQSDNFNMLLGLYKISPLKNSNVYKKFTNKVLLPSRTAELTLPMHYESQESSVENRMRIGLNLKHIEDVIHATTITPRKSTLSQYYSVENKGPEFFSEAMKPSYIFKVPTQVSEDAQFNNILEHIDSNDVDTINTKLVPVNVTLKIERTSDKNVTKNDTIDDIDVLLAKMNMKKKKKCKVVKTDILESIGINIDLNDIDEEAVVVLR